MAITGTTAGEALSGTNDAELIDGLAGHDTINAGDGADTVLGGDGEDIIAGELGDDSLSGGADADLLSGGDGADTLDGGDGFDRIAYTSAASGVSVNLATGAVSGGGGVDTLVSIEQVSGSNHNDTLIGSDGDNYLWSLAGSDTLTGGAGADIFHSWGDAGLDRVLDFNFAQGDRVNLLGGTTYSVAQVGADTVITMTGGGQLVLVGVQSTSLTDGWITVG